MTGAQNARGGAAVGYISDLDGLEAASVIYLRLWCDGPEAQAQVWNDFVGGLGHDQGRRTLHSFEQLCALCQMHARRPLMRRSLHCKCFGADEFCFANFIATAAEGEREDALLIATWLVRPDVAPLVVALAAEVGLALKRMRLRATEAVNQQTRKQETLH